MRSRTYASGDFGDFGDSAQIFRRPSPLLFGLRLCYGDPVPNEESGSCQIRRATIKAVPHQHIPQHHKKLNVEVDYDTPDGEDPPNDVHIDYRKLSSFNGDWKPLYDKNIDAHQSWPFELQFDKPEDDGTYDIRLR